MNNLEKIYAFLGEQTPKEWTNYALESQELLLIDHAHCEKKAASTALALLYRYVKLPELLQKMSRLAREELRHFEQVLSIMESRDIEYRHLTASRYMKTLHAHVRQEEPYRLVDTLILGALVEARSCERFACLIPHLDDELSQFYAKLVRSEGRHFEDYLGLARQNATSPIDERVAQLREIENDLICSGDTEFRFHSGRPEFA